VPANMTATVAKARRVFIRKTPLGSGTMPGEPGPR
jgi:hypothetical protein